MSKTKSLFVLFVLCASFAHAGVFKGSAGAGATKFYTFNAVNTGSLQMVVLFDNAGSNINIGIGSGSSLICASISTIKQSERVECGIPPGNYNILVQNFSGPATPYRLYIGYGLNAIGTAMPEQNMKELKPQPDLNRMSDQLRALAATK